jgi:hypothetical protein
MAHPTHDQFRNLTIAMLGQFWTISYLVHPGQAFRQLHHCDTISYHLFHGEGWQGTHNPPRQAAR